MQTVTLRRVALPFVTVAMITLIVAGCSSSGDSSGTSSSTKAPEQIIVADAKVTAGLAAMKTLFTRAASAIDANETASTFPADIENQWKQIEGTVKKNAPDDYLQVEEALSSIDNAVKDGNASDAKKAAQDFSTAADAYLAQYP